MISSRTARALYITSKRAKQHAARASEAHSTKNHNVAKERRDEKERLYTLKANALEQLHPEAERIERHEIEGREYYCFYFEDDEGQSWSFHVPTKEVVVPTDMIQKEKELPDFEATKEFERASPQSLDGNAEQVLFDIVDIEEQLESMGF